jgi:regulator of sirC expression with transglutaminase-like and TPR domain
VDLRPDLTLFAHLVKRPDAELDLGQAALLISEADGPGVDVSRWVAELDQLGADAAKHIGDSPRSDGENEAALAKLIEFLYVEHRFRGNSEDYYDPRNSYLDQVLERRLGIPITLAVVILEVARRAAVNARGVSFPGHFLVRAPGSRGTVFVDPFDGRSVGRKELRALHLRATGEDRDPDPRVLEPSDKQQILMRMLNNLRGIWERRGDAERLRGIEERIHILKGGGVARAPSFKS